MKQLLIVNSNKALDAGLTSNAVTDLSDLQEGAISIFELGAAKSLAETSAKPATKNFAIALGRGTNKPAFVIPEVDIDTLEITHTYPFAPATFSATFSVSSSVAGKDYTMILVKKGVLLNERNNFSVTVRAKDTTANNLATALRKAVNDKNSDMFPFAATGSGAQVIVTCQNSGEDWELKLADELYGISLTSKTTGRKAIGDKAFIEDLAQRCAADKGYVYLDQASKDIYPGYPETVEGGWTMNTSGSAATISVDGSSVGNSTTGYKLFNLHFATRRMSGKTGDELVWQYVHIAIPLTKADGSTAASALAGLNAILPEGNYSEVAMRKALVATSDSDEVGFLNKGIADDLYVAK